MSKIQFTQAMVDAQNQRVRVGAVVAKVKNQQPQTADQMRMPIVGHHKFTPNPQHQIPQQPKRKRKPPVGSGLRITIQGQIRGGKNNMIITRTGRHFPKPEWQKWRDDAVRQVRLQLPTGFPPITKPVDMILDYWAGDRLRRDMPAIIDSIFHVLEKSGLVEDDTLIWVTESARNYDSGNPHATMTFMT